MPRRALLVAVLLIGCSEKAQQQAPVQRAPGVQASSIPAPAAPVPVVDSFAEEYRQADDLIREWRGDAKKLEDAKTLLMAIVAKDRQHALAYAGLARVEYQSGYIAGNTYDSTALNRAWKLVRHALKLSPDLFEAHIAAGWISRFQGEIDSAQESTKRAEEIRPGTPDVRILRAEIAEMEADPRESVRHAREALEVAKAPRDRAAAYAYLIQAYEYGDHLDEADAAYREQVRLTPDSAWVHGNYAGFLLRRDDVDGAIREGEAAVRISPYPLALGTLAQSYLAKARRLWDENRIPESVVFVQKAGALASDNPHVAYALGSFYEGAAIRGKDPSMRANALTSYKRSLELLPGYEDARRAVRGWVSSSPGQATARSSAPHTAFVPEDVVAAAAVITIRCHRHASQLRFRLTFRTTSFGRVTGGSALPSESLTFGKRAPEAEATLTVILMVYGLHHRAHQDCNQP